MATLAYQGSELTLFALATRWKAYYATRLHPYIGGEVLEVGAGMGTTTRVLCQPNVRFWTCLEPDPELAGECEATLARTPLGVPTAVRVGTLFDLPEDARFDSILYIDVLEHIEDDAGELRRAMTHLRAGGKLIVLAPAHQALFSEFDSSIGHYRRYNARSLRAVGPTDARCVRTFYLDSLGMALSLGNRLLLRSASPSPAQIRFWDNVVVPISRVLDPLICHRVGKTVVAVWQRVESPA